MTPVVDGHHHIWRQADLPWLLGPMQARIFGPYEPIRRDYPIEEFRADIAGSDVVKSVYVQTNWAPEAYEDEAAWVQRTADRTGWPHAIVAYADFGADDVRPQLDRLSRYRLFAARACNCIGTRTRNTASRRGGISPPIPKIRRNIGYLADYGLELRPAGVRAANGRRGRPRRVLSEGRRSCSSTPACSRICRPPDARNGARAWCAFQLAETSSPSSRASALSCIATISGMSLTWSARPSGSSAPAGVCSDRTFRSRSCGPRMPHSSKPIATPSLRLAPRNSRRSCMTRR